MHHILSCGYVILGSEGFMHSSYMHDVS